MEPTAVTINFAWTPHGFVARDGRTLRFTPTPRSAGLYRFDLDDRHTYIGEAGDLARRFSGYRNPGGSPDTIVPRTNRRVQRKILEALDAGRVVPVLICVDASFTVNGETAQLPLSDKTHRLLVEAAAMIEAQRSGHTLENLPRS
jgi:hypothetical protein